MEAQLEGPHLHHVAVAQRLLHLDRKLDTVDEGAVGAAQVHDAAAGGVCQYARVVQGDGGVGQGEIVVPGTAHVDGGLLDQELLGFVPALDGERAEHLASASPVPVGRPDSASCDR